ALLDREFQFSQQYVFEMAGADDITIEYVSVTNGEYGIYGDDGADSDNLKVLHSKFFGSQNWGIYLNDSNDRAIFSDNDFTGAGGGKMGGLSGVYADSDYAVASSNTLHTDLGTGISLFGIHPIATGNLIDDANSAIHLLGDDAEATVNIISNCGTGITI